MRCLVDLLQAREKAVEIVARYSNVSSATGLMLGLNVCHGTNDMAWARRVDRKGRVGRIDESWEHYAQGLRKHGMPRPLIYTISWTKNSVACRGRANSSLINHRSPKPSLHLSTKAFSNIALHLHTPHAATICSASSKPSFTHDITFQSLLRSCLQPRSKHTSNSPPHHSSLSGLNSTAANYHQLKFASLAAGSLGLLICLVPPINSQILTYALNIVSDPSHGYGLSSPPRVWYLN